MVKILALIISKVFLKFSYYYWYCIYYSYRDKYLLPKTFKFNGVHILFYGDGNINVGEHSYIGDFSTVQAVKGANVNIGSHCQISHNVRIYTQSNIANTDFSKQVNMKTADVSIGSYCWIGANVFINPGIEVGNNSVVGANSVVTKNIPENEIWAGVPAKFIRKKTI